ncbi:MAG TPA: GMP/IMP nucleotidase [Steroidobacteraceae bacterium]|nr:GMP/IMP nucleotidase [Steroidobacteraceae bacterium]
MSTQSDATTAAQRSPAPRPEPGPAPRPVPWTRVDTVLLDLDGTLLDLAFDSRFWRESVPAAWGRARSIEPEQARELLAPRFRAREGTLEWYCIDYWSRELQLDIAALKRAEAHRIRWLPGAREFLGRVRALGKRLVLLTNAHPTTLAIKDARTQVISYFDAAFSSHRFGAPKEQARFWERLARAEAFNVQRSLFVDDSLPVLRAASAAGISTVYAVHRPDSSVQPRVQQEFAAVDAVGELLQPGWG